jgi:hypothetical protein
MFFLSLTATLRCICFFCCICNVCVMYLDSNFKIQMYAHTGSSVRFPWAHPGDSGWWYVAVCTVEFSVSLGGKFYVYTYYCNHVDCIRMAAGGSSMKDCVGAASSKINYYGTFVLCRCFLPTLFPKLATSKQATFNHCDTVNKYPSKLVLNIKQERYKHVGK